MNKNILQNFRTTIIEKKLNILGIHIYHKGDILEHRFHNNDMINIYSASKTFTSIGLGIAIDEGLISLYDKVSSFFPEYANISKSKHNLVNIRNLLHMSSGASPSLTGSSNERNLNRSTDFVKNYFETEIKYEPGTHFEYHNLNTYMIGRIISKVTGLPLIDYLRPRLFDKLNINYVHWLSCPKGYTLAATGLMLTTEELSRLGIMLLKNGKYNGHKIVNSYYIEKMSTDTIITGSSDIQSKAYGYQVWNCNKDGIYRVDGMYGQLSIVDTNTESVITITSNEEFNVQGIINSAIDDILIHFEK